MKQNGHNKSELYSTEMMITSFLFGFEKTFVYHFSSSLFNRKYKVDIRIKHICALT